mmetsp:Transcript_123899/g.300849  ORF Transcript_123899/g.300849 Transcript_123899/m.300849 type:complete len:88 (+) Transcript_123899:206-469(+)
MYVIMRQMHVHALSCPEFAAQGSTAPGPTMQLCDAGNSTEGSDSGATLSLKELTAARILLALVREPPARCHSSIVRVPNEAACSGYR